MLEAITKKYTDHSTTDSFAFSFYCDECGKEWRSAPDAFSNGAFKLPIEAQVHTMLWTAQHHAAYEQANRDALFFFTYCTKCGKRVCEDCFYIAEPGKADICKKCFSEAKE